MKIGQTRAGSFMESIINTAVGLAIALVTNMLVLPLFGYAPTWGAAFGMAAIFTVISVVRGYAMRRVFELLHRRTAPPQFTSIVEEIARERLRQINGEGYSLDHDDDHENGEIAAAAAAYAYAASLTQIERHELLVAPTAIDTNAMRIQRETIFALWPWARGQLKITHRRRDLIKAGAMIVAEIGRLDRIRGRRP